MKKYEKYEEDEICMTKIRRQREWCLRYDGDQTWMERSDWVTYEDFLDAVGLVLIALKWWNKII